MSHPEAPAAAPVVEPIVKDVLVRCDPARAFDTFTNSIGRWWPMEGHSVGGASARVEFRSGVLVEVLADGTDVPWGEVVRWEPPTGFTITWHPGYASGTGASLVAVDFIATDDGTRVRLEHSRWEAAGEHGADVRPQYVTGWDRVLARYVAAAHI